MMDLSRKSVLIVAHGLYAEFAVAMAKQFGKVWFCPWSITDYPQMEKRLLGYGMEGIEVIPNPFAVPEDKVDLWCFPGIGHADYQMKLRREGKLVFGAGNGDELEIDRASAQRHMQALGLPTNPFDSITGIEPLLKYLETHPGVYVKIEDGWRGNFESMEAVDSDVVRTELRRLQLELGPFEHLVKFTCEKPLLNKTEAGLDLLTVDGKFSKKVYGGYEIKDCGFAGCFMDWEKVPAPVRLPFETLAPTLARYKYRSFLSTESRIGKDKKPFTIDLTCRAPSPPNEIFIELDKALPQRVWAAAHGEIVEPDPIAQYGACAMIKSGEADKIGHHCIQFPSKYRRNVKIHYPVKIEGKYYACTNGILGAVIGWGSTLKAAREMVKEVAGEVQGHKLNINVEALDKAEAEIEKAEEYGIRMFPKG